MTPRVSRILVVEDDEPQAEALSLALEREGFQVEIARSVEPALDRLRVRDFDLVLTDLVLGDRDGIDLLREARRMRPELSVILITGHGSVETAVRAMQEGAADYINKPVNLQELRARVRRELEKRQLAEDNRTLRAELDERFGLEGIVGHSAAMQPVFETIRQVAPTDVALLVLGPSGTGKELVAHACHQLSRRSDRRFVAINCAALSETLIESELFGHTKGAFTGANVPKIGKIEYADGGTLFLDEVGDMPLATQAKLLRVLEDFTITPVGSNEERRVDVRIFAATNSDLEAKVKSGEFREDLFYRLAVITIDLPPLSQRLEDLPLLVEHFLREFCEKHGREIERADDEIFDRFRAHAWPGNVRELRNTVETMVVLDRDGVLGVDDLPRTLRGGAGAPAAETEAAPVAAGGGGYSLVGKSLEQVERDLIAATLETTGGNRQRTAAQLGMGERTLYRKIKEYGL